MTYLLLRRGTRYTSQFGQDRFVHRRFFSDKVSGTFVDIGANDGIKASNTYFFEKELGWSGVCIEPIPRVYDELVRNRSCICVNACVADFDGTADFFEITGRWEVLSGIINKYDPRHNSRVQKAIRSESSSGRLVPVKCFKLMDILNRNGIRKIDFLSLDTEGGELDILKTIDYAKIAPRVIAVENNYCAIDIFEYLTKKGYDFYAVVGVDEIYARTGE